VFSVRYGRRPQKQSSIKYKQITALQLTETVKHQVQADNSTPLKEVIEYHINIMAQATDEH